MVNTDKMRPSVSERPPMTFEELRTSGVLWAINKNFLHPQGYALALCIDGNDKVVGWQMFGDGSEPWSFESDEPEATAFAAFLAESHSW
jgi:hypothetical protein